MSDTTEGGNGSASLQGTVVAIYEIGCLFGSLFTFFFGERLGRRWMIMLGCTVLIVGAVLQTTAYGIPQMIVGRIVTGLGNGMNTSTVPVWHSETSHAHNRGRSLAIELAINIFGVMTAYWIDYGMSFVDSQAQFRVPLALQMAFAVATILLIQVCPESPRWLLKHKGEEASKAVLAQLSVHQGPDAEPHVQEELEIIRSALLEEERTAKKDKNGNPMSPIRACFTLGKDRYFQRVMLGVGGQFMQQLCGINLITYCESQAECRMARIGADLQTPLSSLSSRSECRTASRFYFQASTASHTSCLPLSPSGSSTALAAAS